MSLITIHWRAPPKGGDFLYVVVYMRRALALCSLHDEDIILHINEYQFILKINDEVEIKEEIQGLINIGKISKDIRSDIRLEIYGQDDFNMDYFNDFTFIVSALNKSGFVIYSLAGEEVI